MGEGPAYCGWCHPWTGGPGFCNKVGWASPEEPASKQHSSMASASAPVSRFLSCLCSCPEFLWWWNVTWKYKPDKPFPPPSCFDHVFLHSNRNPDCKTLGHRDGSVGKGVYLQVWWPTHMVERQNGLLKVVLWHIQTHPHTTHIIGIQLSTLIYLFLYELVCCLHVCKGVRFPGTGVSDSCVLPRGCWQLNLSPLEEQSVLLTTEPSPQPKIKYSLNKPCSLFEKFH